MLLVVGIALSSPPPDPHRAQNRAYMRVGRAQEQSLSIPMALMPVATRAQPASPQYVPHLGYYKTKKGTEGRV